MNATPTKPTLADLLRRAIDDRTGAPLRDIQALVEAEEAVRPRGMSLNRSTASQILRGAYRGTPSQATVRAIGWLAGVSDEEAFAAAGQPPPGRPLVEELPAAADTLNDRERAVVIDVVRALLAQRQHTDEWKATIAKALTHIIGELSRITQTLDNFPADGDDSVQTINDATNELAHVIARTRRLAEQCAPEATPTSADI
jgi:ABC-type transporter Mla subunit MlaD